MKNENLYAVRSYFEISTSGKPKMKDKAYVKTAFMIEERLVLIKAASENAALQKAEQEAKDYASQTYENTYGENVNTKLLEIIDCSEITSFDSGTEILSVTEVLLKRPSKKYIAEKTIGGSEIPKENLIRRKFVQA